MVATRRAAKAENSPSAAEGSIPTSSTPTPRRRQPVKIEFDQDHIPQDHNHNDEQQQQQQQQQQPRTTRRRITPMKHEHNVEQEPAQDQPPRRQQPRQSAAATASSIGQMRQLIRTTASSSSSPTSAQPLPPPSPPLPSQPAQEPAPPPKEKRVTKAVKAKAAASPRKLVRKNSAPIKNEEVNASPSSSLPAWNTILAFSLFFLWIFYNRQTHLVGYCDSSSASSSSSTTLSSNSNALTRALELQDTLIHDDANNTSPSSSHDNLPWELALFPPYLRPTCSPCPAHALCQTGTVLGCASREYAATSPTRLSRIPLLRNILPHDGRLPPWLGGRSAASSSSSSSSAQKTQSQQSSLSKLLGFTTGPLRWLFGLAHGPRCVPDTHKLYLALQVGDEISRVTRERRGKMECGLIPYPSKASIVDVKAWDTRLRAQEGGGGGGSARKWGRGSKSDTPLPLRNVPHWPEPFLVEPSTNDNDESTSSPSTSGFGVFTTDPQAYESDDFMRYNASSGPGGYVRWDLLQQHYRDVRFAESEHTIKADLLERIDVSELSCSGAPLAQDLDEEEGEEVNPHRREVAQACFEELWELALTDLQRPNGVLRFPLTGFPPPAALLKGQQTEEAYKSPLLLSTTSLRPLSCSLRLAAVSALLEILPWFGLTTALLTFLSFLRRRGKERKEEVRVAGNIREEVLRALKDRAAMAGEERERSRNLEADTSGMDLLGDLSLGADEDGQAYLPIAHLRDVLLPAAGSSGRHLSVSIPSAGTETDKRASLSPKRARRVWASVRSQVGSNSNVRTNSRIWKGASMMVWEWVGVV
ncbi:unnamed protein product [Tilletia controversa]|nr:unnamed protein product [Tilletia controversa]